MYKDKYNEWMKNAYFDDETKKELKSIQKDEKEIEDRFYMDLEFGTAGMRGVIGAGTNRMNIYTVRKATQGLSNYIIKQKKQNKGVAIAYDSRRMSPEFALEAACCLAANGIKAFLFESLRATPQLSFAVRELGCIAGINVTASHNPPEYNGFKVYWEDGAQITPPHDIKILEEVKSITDYSTMKTITQQEAKVSGLLCYIGKEVDDQYIAALKKLVLNAQSIIETEKDLNIVYTPLHGTGNVPVTRILKELGFSNVYVVKEQEAPDGNFPTVNYPNPEAEEAFELAKKLAEEKNADIILATDPDADRLGAYIKDSEGNYVSLSGNVSGCLIAEYEISQKKEKFGLPKDGKLVKTIVTTKMADAIASYYGIEVIEVLTGFKYIGEQILGFEKTGNGTYVFGLEESYGCLIGTYARDKDAISATMVLCEALAYYKTRGKSLYDVLEEMYQRYGYYLDGVQSITLKGKEGLEKIAHIMEALPEEKPTKIGGFSVLKEKNYRDGSVTNLPKANVLYYELEGKAWVCIRPSGTEPKIKLYYGVKGENCQDAKEKAQKLGNGIEQLVNRYL